MHNADGRMIAHIALAVLVAMSAIAIVPANSSIAPDSNGYVFVPLSPITIKNEFQKGSVIPIKFHLFDPSGAPVKDAYAWILVNDWPGRGAGNSNYFNEFRLNGATYAFNFDTTSYSFGSGPQDLKLTIEIMIGMENPLLLWENFDITLV